MATLDEFTGIYERDLEEFENIQSTEMKRLRQEIARESGLLSFLEDDANIAGREITKDDLVTYLSKDAAYQAFETHLNDTINDSIDHASPTWEQSERYIVVFLKFLNATRNSFRAERKKRLSVLPETKDGAPALKTIREHGGTIVSGAMDSLFGPDASIEERAGMAVGIFGGAYMLLKAYQMDGKKGKMIRAGTKLGAMYLGVEALNKGYYRRHGKPLWDFESGNINLNPLSTNPSWWNITGMNVTNLDANPNLLDVDERQHEMQEDSMIADEATKMIEEIEKTPLNPEYFGGYIEEEKSKTAFALFNMGSITVAEFRTIYAASRQTGQLDIRGANALPQRIVKERDVQKHLKRRPDDTLHILSPTERYQVLVQLGQALGILNAAGDILSPYNQGHVDTDTGIVGLQDKRRIMAVALDKL